MKLFVIMIVLYFVIFYSDSLIYQIINQIISGSSFEIKECIFKLQQEVGF